MADARGLELKVESARLLTYLLPTGLFGESHGLEQFLPRC